MALVAAGAATVSLALQVVSFGGHETPAQSGDYFSSLGSIFGVPVIAIPVAILVAVVGVAELLARNVRTAPVSSVPAATAVPVEHSSLDLRLQYPNEVTDAASREEQLERRGASGQLKAFGRFVRGDERTLNAIREDLATAASRSRAVLVDSVAEIESRLSMDLEEHARVRASTHTAVESLQETVTDCATDVSFALSGIADMCARVADRIEVHRLERHALVDAIALLAQPVSTVREAPAVVPALRSLPSTPNVCPILSRPVCATRDGEITAIWEEESSHPSSGSNSGAERAKKDPDSLQAALGRTEHHRSS